MKELNISPEQRKREFEGYRQVVEQMVSDRAAHIVERPDCDAAPFCAGPDSTRAAIRSDRVHPGHGVLLALTAVALLAEERSKHERTLRSLEVQRGLTGDALVAMEKMDQDLQQARDEIEALTSQD